MAPSESSRAAVYGGGPVLFAVRGRVGPGDGSSGGGPPVDGGGGLSGEMVSLAELRERARSRREEVPLRVLLSAATVAARRSGDLPGVAGWF